MSPKRSIVLQTAFARYESAAQLGEGATGVVFTAVDDFKAPVAIKLLHPTKATRARTKRFKNEYLFGFTHAHPHLVKVLDFGVVEYEGAPAPFYVMPQYRGSLRPVVTSGLKHDDVLAVFAQMLSGVEAAHLLGVVHRDLKPENILVNGLTDVVIADFGIAHFAQEDLYTAVETKQGDRLANFHYAAPEQKKRGALVDQRADIFALGLMLNELFTGEVPQGVGFKTIGGVSTASSWLDEVVASMIQADPALRPSGVPAVREMLRMKSSQFEERQRLSNLAKTVVSADAVDDPLAVEPPKVVGADFDGADVVITLDRPASEGWIAALRNMGNYTSVYNAGPEYFRFAGNVARVRSNGDDAQQIVNHFKSWLSQATARYAHNIRVYQVQQEQQRADALQRARAELERRERIRASLKI